MKKYISLIVWIIVLELVGSGIGLLTKESVDSWYITLNRSPLTPPNYLFGIVWSILYTMIAASGWLIWQAKELAASHIVKKSYIIQLLLNWSWMPLFFYYQLTGTSLACMSAIIILVGFIIIKTYNRLRLASLLLIPYFLWLLFASHLNFYIWAYN